MISWDLLNCHVQGMSLVCTLWQKHWCAWGWIKLMMLELVVCSSLCDYTWQLNLLYSNFKCVMPKIYFDIEVYSCFLNCPFEEGKTFWLMSTSKMQLVMQALQESLLFSKVENVEKSIRNHRKKYFQRFKWPLRTATKNYVETFFLQPIWP